MVMTRFVKIWFATLGCQAKLFLELLTGDSSFENAMELLGIDIEW